MRRLPVLLALLITVRPLFGWNATGHKAIALIAYQHLTPVAKSRVDALLEKHPDYAKWIEGVAPSDRGRVAFMEASTWPDDIRSDRRFHDDNRLPTADIPGLPPGGQARHAAWHYINLPFSPDGTPTQPPADPNILKKLQDFESFGSMPEQMQVYLLPWILHLVGDVHQPLHVMTRFTEDFPNGDRGGNLVQLRNTLNLHSYWDSRIGTGQTDRFLNQLAATIERRHPKPDHIELNPQEWVEESFDLRTIAYDVARTSTESDPARISDEYAVMARNIALEQGAKAGYRLTEFFNVEFFETEIE